MNWFESWFNSKYYHILYKKRDEKEARLFIDNLLDYLSLKKGAKIIDIACGKGRHAAYLSSMGFSVIGIDLAKNSILEAKKDEIKNLKFFVHDMRNSYKKNYFDLSLNLFTSFGYFKNDQDDQKAILAMVKNLKKNGILIIDFMNVKKIIDSLVLENLEVINGIRFSVKREIVKNRIVKSIKVIDKSKTLYFQEKVKTLMLEDFTKILKEACVEIIDIFGSYSLDEFDEKVSDRLILIAKK